MKTAYVAATLIGILSIGLRSVMLKEVPILAPGSKKGFRENVVDSFVAGVRAVRRSNVLVKRLLLYVALAGVGTGLTSTLVPLFVVKHLSISPTDYSLVVDADGVATFCLYLGIVFLIKRVGVRRSILLSAAASPVSNLLLTQARNTSELMGWGIGGAVNVALQTSSLSTMQAEVIQQEEMGKILAVFSILPSAAAFPSQAVAGFLYNNVSPAMPFVASIVPFSLAAIVLYSVG